MKTTSKFLALAALVSVSFLATAGDAPAAKAAPAISIKPPASAPQGGPQGGPPVRPEKITRAEAIKKATDQFDAIDLNHDGIVTRDEIMAYQEKMRPQFAAQRPAPAAPAAPAKK